MDTSNTSPGNLVKASDIPLGWWPIGNNREGWWAIPTYETSCTTEPEMKSTNIPLRGLPKGFADEMWWGQYFKPDQAMPSQSWVRNEINGHTTGLGVPGLGRAYMVARSEKRPAGS